MEMADYNACKHNQSYYVIAIKWLLAFTLGNFSTLLSSKTGVSKWENKIYVGLGST